MAEHVIRLPDVGEGIAEAELVEWHVKVGDLVRADTTLAAVMTDKATVEIPSPVDGEITWLGAAIGDKVAVGSDLVRLKIPGERDAASAALPQPRSAAAETAEPVLVARPRVADSEDRGTAMSPMPSPRPAQPAEPQPALRQRRAPTRSGRSRRRQCACAREMRASTCVRYRARGRPAALRTTTSTHSPIAVTA
jgi:2-oxoisovalerate dehydrogenase E2 component (dihydrolipoyl transacylase)